jgi:hypothetical protein
MEGTEFYLLFDIGDQKGRLRHRILAPKVTFRILTMSGLSSFEYRESFAPLKLHYTFRMLE